MAADFHVFLSHNAEDKPLVREIATRLAAAGLKPWLDVDELQPGLPWQDGLEKAMRTTGAAAVFLGRHGVGSWQKPEIRVCLSQMVERGQPVIPVLLPGAPDKPELNLFLREITWVDLREGLSEEGLNRLIWGITGEKRETGQPSSPSAQSRKLKDALDAAQRLLKERTIAGQDTGDVREEILQIRRDIRDGVRLQPDDRLSDGRFHLLEVFGRGGFATVWKAWDEQKAGLVAVKILHGQHAEDRSRRERFFRGAHCMAELHHPGIVRVFEEHLEWGGHHYFVMEFIAGGDLRQAVLAGKLPPNRVLPLILEIGEALSYAHGRGIIHRDVKPANVLLDGDRPKLTDFDLVRAFDSTGGTQTQGHLGTFLYSAPETLENAKEAGVAADVYSLAMTAAFALHGKDLPPDVWRQPEVFFEKLACPAAVRDALRRGSAWESDERTASVTALCKELCRSGDPRAEDERTNEKDRPGKRAQLFHTLTEKLGKGRVGRRPVWKQFRTRFVEVATLLLALGIFALWQRHQALVSQEQSRDRERVAIAANLVATSPTEAGLAGLVLLEVHEPDSTPAANETLYKALYNESLATLIGHTDPVLTASFDRDGTRVVTASRDKTARVWNAATGKTLAILTGHAAEVFAASFSPDGTRVVTASYDKTARLWDAATGQPIATLGHAAEVFAASFSPEGRRVVTASLDKTARVWNAATGKTIAALTGHAASVVAASFSPDGTRVVTASDDKTARVWNAATGQPITTLTGHAASVVAASFSLDGTRVVTTSNDNTVRVWNAATGQPIATLADQAWAFAASFSPAGDRVVTASSSMDNNTQAQVWNANTGKKIADLPGHAAPVVAASFSPDSSRVVTASRDNKARVWNAATGELIATLTGHAAPVVAASFSPDGRRVVTASLDKTARVWASTGGDLLQSRVRALTPLCLQTEFRQATLGESAQEAESHEMACKVCTPKFFSRLKGVPSGDSKAYLAAWKGYRQCFDAAK